jgi:hypothetical protein
MLLTRKVKYLLSRIQFVSQEVIEQPSLGYADTVTVGVQLAYDSVEIELQLEDEVAETYSVPKHRRDGQLPSHG